MMISENFFSNKFDNENKEIVNICDIFYEWHKDIPKEEEINSYEEYIDCYAALETYLLSKSIQFNPIELVDRKSENIEMITTFFHEIRNSFDKKLTHDILETSRNKYKIKLNVGFAYEFTDGDLKRIQTLINELREQITGSNLFEANHRERLLSKLEKLQSELHKKVSSLDQFWGMVGDAGVVLGKFGQDAKPLFDRIREITQIVWNTQIRAEELPSETKIPLLGNK